MEESVRVRVDILINKLNETIRQTQELCQRSESEPIEIQELFRLKYLLKSSSDTLDMETHKFIQHFSPDLIQRGTETQLSAVEVIAALEAIIAVSKQQLPNTMEVGHTFTSHTKLPKLALPKFGGNHLKWNEFWDRFDSAVNKKNLSDADKLAYLMGCLEGTALEAIEGLATTNANYNIALNILSKQYGSRDTVIDAHYEALINLPKAQNTPEQCRNTLNMIERHLRILKSLGEQVDGNHLRTTVLSKFPEKVVYDVNLTSKDNRMDTLRDNLDRIVSITEKSVKPKPIEENSENVATTESLHINTQVSKRKFKFSQNKRRFNNEKNYKYNNKNDFKRKRTYPQGDSSSSPSKKTKLNCIFCRDDHFSSDCTKVQNIAERKEKLKNRCYRCLRIGHIARKCRKQWKCLFCKENHHQVLCPNRKGKNDPLILNESHESSHISNNNTSFLQTARVNITSRNNSTSCRLLLDSGSQRSYITRQAANKLKLIPDKRELLIIFTFGSENPKETSSPSAEVTIITKRGISRTIRVNIVPYITNHIRFPPAVALEEPIDILADDDTQGEGIDLLIGNDYYFSFVRNEKMQYGNNLFLVDSDFGWIITGCTDNTEKDIALSVVTYCQCEESQFPYFTEPDLPLRDTDMKFLWALESIGITDSAKTTREEEAIQHFNRTIKYEGGRYQVKWPWIEYPPELPTNYGLALGRLTSLIRKLDDKTLEEYQVILQEQLDTGVIEILDTQLTSRTVRERTPPIHYLPHHIVKQDGKRGRIVYDASAKSKTQKSLNECLYRGPSMIEDLTALILKFRTKKVAITADVEKAFLQVGLQTEDREVTRFLWLKDPKSRDTSEENVQHLRFCRVPFGIISSPFLLTATIRYHLSKTNERLLKEIADKCYVDNLVTGASSTEEAKALYQKTRNAFQELSMNIREWISNDTEFLHWIPEQHQAKKTENVKVLGLSWNIEEDTLKLKLNDSIFDQENIERTKNKREVLRTVASFFDPCGIASPLVLSAKLLLQDLWIKKLGWNATIPDDIREVWLATVENLRNAKDIEIPRYIGHNIEIDKNTKYELHCFTDASEKAYAAVTYLRILGNQIKTVFIMSKSRVTPVKDKENLKIPRLELLGYTIGSHLLNYVKKSLDLPISKQYLWTDSIIVLCWMKSNKLLHPFVSRRVSEIKRNKEAEWRYVNTENNPADIATRPELWLKRKQLWLHGPEFMLKEEKLWPCLPDGDRTFFAAGESLVAAFPENMDIQELGNERDVECTVVEGPTDHDGLGEVNIIKGLQKQNFPEEVSGKETHLSRNLGLFMDIDGLLRCQGRMANTSWTYDKKHPILIPRDCDFTNKLIKDIHEKNYHVGASHTLSIIRQQYWIPQGKSQVQKVLRRCQTCVKYGGGPYTLPPTPALPPERVNYSAPFTYTGVDYFGPLFTKTNLGKEKRWICLMTCLAVRAVHMEVVADLTAQECLMAFRRFISTRGIPVLVVSDNALQFKLSAEVLGSPYCLENKIKWKFIPQLAPWHGGFYERLIGIVKHCLRRTLKKHLLTDSQLTTVVKEIEAVVNTRPLTRVGPENDHVLKPADFLTMGRCIFTQPGKGSCIEATITKRDVIEGWKRGQAILEEYKKMFINQYLVGLRERYDHSHKQPRVKSNLTPNLGDVVQIKGDSKNRDTWKVGKVVSLIKGMDGECRVARVKVGDSEFTRSIAHLYPLEVEEDITDRQTEECAKETSAPQTPVQETEISQKNITQSSPEIGTQQGETLQPLHNTPCTEDVRQENREPEQQIDTNSVPQTDDIKTQEETRMLTDKEQVETEVRVEAKPRREAAIKAREKIAQWTSQLFAILFAAGSVASECDSPQK